MRAGKARPYEGLPGDEGSLKNARSEPARPYEGLPLFFKRPKNIF